MLEAHDIRKSYGGVHALRGASLTVRAGSVHALLGENGAGKSTLVKIIAGAVQPDSGTLRLDGREVSFGSTAEAVRNGVAVVSQELSLFPDLDVLSNLYPMREIRNGPFVSRKQMAAKARPVLAELGLDVSLRRLVSSLSLAQRQLLEIAKALITDPRALILDEPTSALEASSTETLIHSLRVLRDRQVAVLFVSHILEEVMALCDEVTVLRDGQPVLEGAQRAQLTVNTIVDAMLGERKPVSDLAAGKAQDAQTHIEESMTVMSEERPAAPLILKDVTVPGVLRDVSFEARPKEIVGLAGLAGSGHSAVIELLSGQRRAQSGTATLPNGKRVPHGMRKAIGAGVALVTGDRRRYGLMLDKPLWDNIAQVRAVALSRDGWFIRTGKLKRAAHEHVQRLRVRTESVLAHAGSLSGGNQQKVVFAKWLDAQPAVLLLDDPTRGVDVGAKAEMHHLIRTAADAGAIVLLASTDLDELEQLADRVLVFHHGRLTAELAGDQLRVHTLLVAMNTGELEPAAA